MGGWAAQARWQRAGGHGFPINKQLTPEDVASKWKLISNFGTSTRGPCSGRRAASREGLVFTILLPDDGRATNPLSTHEAITQVCPRLRVANGNTSPSGIVGGLFHGSYPYSFTIYDI